ncbi:hypothetical protein IAU60_001341 [Kwoniella sp. DSM 27419]
MSRRIGLAKPHPPPVVPPVTKGHSQSQESTQQPSIEIRPSTLTLAFKPPSRATTEPLSSPHLEGGPSRLAASSSDSAIGTSFDGASYEETGESGVAWTQEQLEHNRRNDAIRDGPVQEGLKTISEVPEAAPPSYKPIEEITGELERSRRTTNPRSDSSSTDGDRLEDESFVQDPVEDGALEATEVDDPPLVVTPEQSQPAQSPPPSATAPSMNTHGLTNKNAMSPLTTLSPRITQANGKLSRLSNVDSSSPSRAKGASSALGRNGRDTSPQSDDSSFGKDPVPKGKPLEKLTQFTRRYSKLPQSRLHGSRPGSTISRAVFGSGNRQQDEQTEIDGVVMDGHQGNASDEDEEEGVRWKSPIGQAEGPSRTPSPPSVRRLFPQVGTAPVLPYNPNGNTRPFDLGSSASSQDPLLGQLFSSQGVSDAPDDDQSTQRSNMFQATQVARRQFSSQDGLPALANSGPMLELEATQPATQQQEATQLNGEPDLPVQSNQDLSAPAVNAKHTIMSRHVSVASTSASSRVEVPVHRQLQRRSRVSGDATVSPVNGGFPHSVAGADHAAGTRLQPHRSEAPIVGPDSSPFNNNKSSPVRPSSEPPMLQDTLRSQDQPMPDQRRAIGLVMSHIADIPSESSPKVQAHRTSPSAPASSPADLIVVAAQPTAGEMVAPARDLSLPSIGSRKISPKKVYRGSASKRRRIISPPSPLDRQPTDSSSSGPEDLDDHTYQPAVAPLQAKPTRPRTSATTTGTYKSSRSKRKRSMSSVLSPPSSTSDTSSPAPEDPEDNTYQPTLHIKVKSIRLPKATGKVKASDMNRRDTTKEPVAETMTNGAQVTRLSTPLSSVSGRLTPQVDSRRVLAVYQAHYYPATILGRTAKGYSIQFDDGDTKTNVQPIHMRRLELRKGDRLEASRSNDLPRNFEVAEDWDGNSAGVKCKAGGKSIGRVKLDQVAVRTPVINASFGDRSFRDIEISGLLGPTADRLIGPSRRASLPRSPVKPKPYSGVGSPPRNRRSVSPSKRTSKMFDDMLFLITKGENDNGASTELSQTIKANGGETAQKWSDVFDPASPGGCAFAEKLPGVPFVIATGTSIVITAKIMAALAKGIPCLSSRFIDDSIELAEVADWRAYLISPGVSDYIGYAMSQAVDMRWGEDGWDPKYQSPPRRPFKGKQVLFVTPWHRKYDELKSLVPLCFYLMGVAEFQAVQNLKYNEKIILDDKWDYVLYETRETASLPANLQTVNVLCDVYWLKQCLETTLVDEKKARKRTR